MHDLMDKQRGIKLVRTLDSHRFDAALLVVILLLFVQLRSRLVIGGF